MVSNTFVRLWTRILPAVALLALPATAAAQHSGVPHGFPDYCANTTITAVRSGNWSSPTVWSPARLPGAGDVVVIPTGDTITYDAVSTAAIKAICVDGTLHFRTDVSTRLTVITLRIRPTGGLEVGTTAQPVNANVTAEIDIPDAPIDTTFDPEQYSNGIVADGRVWMYGAVKSPSYVRLASDLAAGTATLPISSAVVGWQPGDKLMLPDSKQWAIESYPYVAEWETVALRSVGSNALSLSSPVQFNHPAGKDGNGVNVLFPHVGNLSRNVIVRSLNPNGVRGHVLCNYHADVDIRYALFKDLGRTTIQPLDNTTYDSNMTVTHVGTNQLGRYSLHMHHVFGPTTPPADGYQFTLIGNAIDGGSKWGITVHNSHYGLIQDNVIYNTQGAGVMTEDGSESFNVFQRNFVAVARGTGDERGDTRRVNGEWGFEGSAFWFRGPNNYVRDNVGANSNSFGYTVLLVDLGTSNVPKFPGADTTVAGQYNVVDMTAMPLLEWARNELYASVDGFTLWNVGAVCCTQVNQAPVSNVNDFTLWNISRYGFYGYGQNFITYNNWTQRNDRTVLSNSYENNLGLWFGDYITRNLVINNPQISGARVGIRAPYKPGDVTDIYGNTPGLTVINGGILQNNYNIAISPMFAVTGGGSSEPPRRTTINGTLFVPLGGDIGGSPIYNIAMAFNVDPRNANIIQSDQVFVTNYNGQAGVNFQAFYAEQAPNFVVPQSAPGLLGAPVAGLTNTQLWSQYRMAIAGAIAPCQTTMSGVQGFACTGTVIPPAPPRNLRITSTQ